MVAPKTQGRPLMAEIWRFLVLNLIGMVVVGVDIVLLSATPSPHWSIDALIWLSSSYVTLWWLSRAGLVWRHHQRGSPSSRKVSNEIIALPTQDKALDEIKALLMPAGERDGRIVSLKGGWGAGKTVTLRRLQEALNNGCEFVPVWINVWRAETEADLHRVFYEEMLHTPAVFRNCWLALPWLLPRFAFLLRRLVRSVRVAFKNGNIEAEADLQVATPLALTVQPQIEWIADRMRHAGLGLVVILEELDRATPVIAKHAIVSVERSFKLPGVTVILPYVQEHLWAKVFNPLDPAPPDLDSGMETLLQQDLLRMAEAATFGSGAESLMDNVPPPEHLGLYAANPIAQAQEAGSGRPLDPRAPLAVWWRYRLHRQFALLDEQHRNRLRRRFSEKYLSGYQVEMAKYGAEDVAALITCKTSLYEMTQRAFPVLKETGDEAARVEIRKAVVRHCGGRTVRRLRHFESFYLRLIEKDLSVLRAVQESPVGGDMQRLLTSIGLAPDAPEALALLGRFPQLNIPDWAFKCAVRSVAALAALAIWYEHAMMYNDEVD